MGLPVVHLSAKLQVTGETEFADDIPMPWNGLHAALQKMCLVVMILDL